MTGPRPPALSVEREAGLQRERTALAWNRTALAIMACGALLVRAGLGTPLVQVPGLAALGAGAVLFSQAHRRGAQQDGPARVGLLRLVGAGTLLLSVAALAVTVGAALGAGWQVLSTP